MHFIGRWSSVLKLTTEADLEAAQKDASDEEKESDSDSDSSSSTDSSSRAIQSGSEDDGNSELKREENMCDTLAAMSF